MEFSKIQQLARLLWMVGLTTLVASCGVKVETGGPFDRSTALQRSQQNLPLPPSAHNVFYYSEDRGTQDQDLFVRFSGEPKDIEQFVEAYFEDQNAFQRQLGKPENKPVMETGQQAMTKKPWGSSRGLPDWWKPDAIKKGHYIGSKPGAFPVRHFWIDEVEGRAFFYGHY